MRKSILKDGRFYEALAVFSLSVLIIIYSISLGAGDNYVLSPALFPMIMGISMLGLSLVLLKQSLINKEKEDTSEKEKINITRLLIVVAITVAYFILMPILHFMLATMLYLFFMILYLGEKEIWISGAVALGTSVVIYYIFSVLLTVRLP